MFNQIQTKTNETLTSCDTRGQHDGDEEVEEKYPALKDKEEKEEEDRPAYGEIF